VAVVALTDAQRAAVVERVQRQRLAEGKPAQITDSGFHRLLGHVIATHRR
jgi:hypothetical protein